MAGILAFFFSSVFFQYIYCGFGRGVRIWWHEVVMEAEEERKVPGGRGFCLE